MQLSWIKHAVRVQVADAATEMLGVLDEAAAMDNDRIALFASEVGHSRRMPGPLQRARPLPTGVVGRPSVKDLMHDDALF